MTKKDKRLTTTQIHPRIDNLLAEELRRMAKLRNTTESSIVEESIRVFLSQTDSETLIIKRLERVSRQLTRFSKDQELLSETLATFIKVYLTLTPDLESNQKSSAESRGVQRFERFLSIVSKAFIDDKRFGPMVEDKIAENTTGANA